MHLIACRNTLKWQGIGKTLLMMKFTAIFLFAVCLNAAAIGNAQRISISEQNAPLEKIFKEIKRQSGYTFVYREALLKKATKVTVQIHDATIEKVLNLCLQDQPLAYSIVNKMVVIKEKKLVVTKEQISTPPPPISIQGKVTNEKGEPLAGATVNEKGTNNSTTTKEDGSFSLNVSQPNAVLTVSYVGFVAKEIKVTSTQNLDIVLTPSVQDMNAVVVVGYGTRKKSDVTGAVQSANLDAFREAPNVNIAQSLQGTVPGLNVGQVNSAGATPSIQIRGANTISGNRDVLIVLDDIIYNGSLTSINPDDIASIDILKDASSTAIYGAQAANGVILITTKKGAKGKPRISYTGSYTTQTPNVDLRPLNRQEFLDKVRDLNYDKAFLAPDYTVPNPDFDLTEYIDFTMLDENNNIRSNDFNWWDEATDPGDIQEHQFSISGANENTNYLISAGLTDQEGFIINDKYNRKSFRVNLETKPTSWWKIGLQSFVAINDYSGAEPDLDALIRQSPLLVPYDENGVLIPSPTKTNVPNPFLTYDVDDYSKRNDFFGKLYSEINFPFLKGLSYRVNFGNNYRVNNDYYASRWDAGQIGEISKNEGSYYDYTLDNILSFNRSFYDKHDMAATLLYGAMERTSRNTSALATDVPSFTLGYNSLELGTVQSVNSGAWKEALNYQMGRINYKYNDKYLLTATLRRDGFSGFARNEKWGLFPSAALGWIVSKEPFMKNLEPLNLLKLRASYGVSGNMVNRYASQATFSRGRRYIFGDGGTPVFGQQAETLGNEFLRWEKTSGINVGLDFGVLNNRLSGNLEYYNTNTNDLLFSVSLPNIIGINQITSNIGELKNTGFELQLTSDNVRGKDFKWSTTVNFSTNKNKIISLVGLDADKDGKEDDLVADNLFISKSLGTIFSYVSNGIYQIGDNIPAGYYPGTFRVADKNGDDRITADDRVILGRTEPAYRFGILNTFTYKGFTLRAFINSVQGGKEGYLGNVLPTSVGGLRDDNSIRYNYFSDIDYWSPSNPGAQFPRSLSRPAITPTTYRSRSFARLQDLSLSYNFSRALIKRFGLSNLSLYVSGKNLVTWTDWQGWDPETGQGFNENGRPVMKGYSVGLNVTL